MSNDAKSGAALRAGRFFLMLCATVGFLGQDGEAAVDWPTLRFTQIGTNIFQSPTCIANARDGSQRLFIVEQAGRVWIIQNSNVLVQPFLVVTNRVMSGGERGLLGLAFPPGFAGKGYFYVNYTRQPDGATVVSRFHLTPNPNVADADSEQVLLTVPQPYPNHNGGQIEFGPDGYLYVGLGDGGMSGDPQNRGQNPSELLGKILRIDVEGGAAPYGIPTNNPFVSTPPFRPEIWAWGLRNPWRFSFDRDTGDLYIGDVGEANREEINFQPADSPGGQNYGWRLKEGNPDYNLAGALVSVDTLTPPVAEYGRDLGWCITGGYVCRDPNGGRLQGIYLFGDLLTRRTFGLKFDGGWQMADLGPGVSYSTFGEDEAGRLYAAHYQIGGGNFGTGGIFLIEDSGHAAAPTFDPPPGNSPGEIITLNSLSPNSTIRYTFEPRTPTESDAGLSPGGQILITNGTTLRAQTFRTGLLPSVVSTGTFNFVVGTPQFAEVPPLVGYRFVPSNTLVTITTPTPNAAIHYTLDGSTPTTNSTQYTGPFPIIPPRTVMARAFRPGFATESAVRTVAFNLAGVPLPGISPVFGPFTNAAEIPITNGTPIRLGCALGAADIFYTLDGSEPTPDSPKYAAPISISGNTMVRAKAFLTNHFPSAVNSVFFRLDPNSPLWIESVTLVTNNNHVRISWQSATGRTYTVRWSTNSLAWNVLVGAVSGTGAALAVTDPTPVSQWTHRFYRVFAD